MILFAGCKINIGLNILSRRADGYHDIETLMYPVPGLCDVVEMLTAAGGRLEFTGSGLEVGAPDEKNLCVKAYRLMKERYGIGGVVMHLHKSVPMGAGLGGGSSDAAFVIKGLSELFGLGLDEDAMEGLAAELGSDTAFFIRNRPAIATGRGEVLAPCPVSLSGYRLVILKPDVAVSTAEAYAGVEPGGSRFSLKESLRLPVKEWRGRICNGFETSVFARYPRIASLKELLYERGALYASMSGSGASVYGIFSGDLDVVIPDCGCFEYQCIV